MGNKMKTMSQQVKEEIYLLLETYRKISGKSVKEFTANNGKIGCSVTSYRRMGHQGVSDYQYLDLLDFHQKTYCQTIPLNEQEQHTVRELHQAVVFYRYDTCIALIDELTAQLKSSQDIRVYLLWLFLEELREYFESINYLDEEQIRAYLSIAHLYPTEIKDLIEFYCVYSAQKVSRLLMHEIYQNTEIGYSKFPPVVVHAMAYDFNYEEFERGIIKSAGLKKQAMETDNHVLLFEYYDSMITYYIQCEPDKVKDALISMEELINKSSFPNAKKIQFYNNAAHNYVFLNCFDQALYYFERYLHEASKLKLCLDGNIYTNIVFCKHMCDMPYDIDLEVLTTNKFYSLADYYLYEYFMEQSLLETRDKKIRFIRNKIIKHFSKDDNFTKYMVRLELMRIIDQSKNLDLILQTM
ncbi:hypothetical protein [Massilicoli timonensis]|uniref:hypothetical protein n=1 Tax=Massilicoli timonensis TaxID=2015901 RepID=UPI000C842597|nr:hypothetical protein [Massilicoli timonensis]